MSVRRPKPNLRQISYILFWPTVRPMLISRGCCSLRQHVLHRQIPVLMDIMNGAAEQSDFSAAEITMFRVVAWWFRVRGKRNYFEHRAGFEGARPEGSTRFQILLGRRVGIIKWGTRGQDIAGVRIHGHCAAPLGARRDWTIFFTSRSGDELDAGINGEANVLAGLRLAFNFRLEAAFLDIAGDMQLARASLEPRIQVRSMPALPFCAKSTSPMSMRRERLIG